MISKWIFRIFHRGLERCELSRGEWNTHTKYRRSRLLWRDTPTTLRFADMYAIKDSFSYRPLSYSNRYSFNAIYTIDTRPDIYANPLFSICVRLCNDRSDHCQAFARDSGYTARGTVGVRKILLFRYEKIYSKNVQILNIEIMKEGFVYR